MNKGISVIMPTYNQSAFINMAINSLLRQTFSNWELIIINDGDDSTYAYIKHHFVDDRISYYENKENEGLGVCLNLGIKYSKYENIAYLPSDDVYFQTHLQTLYEKLQQEEDGILAFSGLRHNYNYSIYKDKKNFSTGQIRGGWLQLAQVLHKKNEEKWVERDELVTDDLFVMFWQKLINKGMFLPTYEVTCEWINHPKQRHKLISKSYNGGINSYREHYRVKKPVKFQSSSGDFIDERKYYNHLVQSSQIAEKGLRILLVGELSYNPERICAFEEQGHTLFGLWKRETSIFYTVGPLPFGKIMDIPYENWVERVREIKPDIIYAQLNSSSVKFAHEVLKNNPGVPFVYHCKEGPFFSRNEGSWKELFELYLFSDGQIYMNQLIKDWFEQFMPPHTGVSFILDGDLPKNNWFKEERSPLLSEKDGEIHTVLLGRPVGFNPEDIESLAKEKIHFHFYGNYQEMWKDWIQRSNALAPGYLHVHPNCTPENWVKEFSKYDAGWLHYFESENAGSLLKVDWHDVNYPARIAPLAAAGLPMIQFDNSGHLVATQLLTQGLDIGVFFKKFEDLGLILNDKELMRKKRDNVWKHRKLFTFDHHVPDLVKFFESVIEKKKAKKAGNVVLVDENT